MELKIEYLPIDELKPYERNTRKHKDFDVGQIAASIEKYGFSDPVGIWSANNLIVEGHGRVLAAKKLGMTEVPCIRLDHLTDEQRREYAIVHNKTAELSEWDAESLKLELADIDFSDFDFNFEDLKISMADFNDGAEVEEVDAAEIEDSKPPVTEQGDIWVLGEHRLMCGDSTVMANVITLMGEEEADLLVTDPPYNVNYEGTAGKIQNDNMEDGRFKQFLQDAFQCADAVMKPGASFYIWHAGSEGYNFLSACKETGWTVRQCLIWNKNSLVLGRQDYQWKHEPCLYGWKGGAAHKWYSDRSQTTVLDFDKPKKSDIHPTMKPIALFDYQMKNSSQRGDKVLDIFGGSGTAIIACEQNGRKCYTMELDERYCDAIIKRWQDYTGKKAVCLNNGEKAVY